MCTYVYTYVYICIYKHCCRHNSQPNLITLFRKLCDYNLDFVSMYCSIEQSFVFLYYNFARKSGLEKVAIKTVA